MKIPTGVLVAVSLLIAGQVVAEEQETKTAGLGLFSVHELRLKPGINHEDFESFMLNEWIPPYNKLKGLHIYLTRGDRGVRVRTGEYAIVFVWASVEDHDRVYPPSGEVSEDRLRIHKQRGGPQPWEKFQSMSEGLGETFTDYVVIAP